MAVLGLMYAATEFLRLSILWWLGKWTSQPREGGDEYFYMGVYVALGVLSIITGVAVNLTTSVLGFRAATNMHDAMFASVLRAPMRFFQDTPHGRLINRFSKDMGSMDELLPPAFFDVLTVSSK